MVCEGPCDLSRAGLHDPRSSLCLHRPASSASFLLLGNAKLITSSEPLCLPLTLPQCFVPRSSAGSSLGSFRFNFKYHPLREAFLDHSVEKSLKSLSILLLCYCLHSTYYYWKLSYFFVHLFIVCLFLLKCSLCEGRGFLFCELLYA